MGRRRKPGFSEMKMLAARVESSDFEKLEHIVKYRDHKSLQEFVNLLVVNYISGTFHLSGSTVVVSA